MTPRFIILNSMLIAGLGLMWVAGLMDGAFHGLTGIGVGLIALVLVIGLSDVARGRFKSARWIETQIPYLGIGMTVLGLIMAFGNIDMTADAMMRVGSVQKGISIALHCTFASCLSVTWLRLNIRLFGNLDG